jgi:hypothetical protein
LNTSGKFRWLRTAIPIGLVYLVAGVALPNPPASDPTQFAWRLAAWVISAVAFGIHIGLEHFRLQSSLCRIALHVAAAVALGGFGLAVAANIHALTAGTGNQGLLALALVIWPIMTGLPAFVVALGVAAVLARVLPNDK